MSDIQHSRKLLLGWFQHALNAVDGRLCVRSWLAEHTEYATTGEVVHCVAIGKAASAMMQGVVDSVGTNRVHGLIICREGLLNSSTCSAAGIHCLESSHPVPSQRSLDAGQALLHWLSELPVDARVLFLLSGGTSSLVEVLRPGICLSDLVRANTWLLGSGLAINQVNAVRRCLSTIKGGGLRQAVEQRQATVLMVSDVPGDDPAIVGSGLLYAAAQTREPDLEGWGVPDWLVALCEPAMLELHRPDDMEGLPDIPHHCIASNADARQAVADKGAEEGYSVHQVDAILDGDAVKQGKEIAAHLVSADAGLWIWGGETTVQLPDRPGRGGRNQNLALAAAVGLAGIKGVTLLAAGTDGVDGNTDDAGALVDAWTLARGEQEDWSATQCLQNADAGSFLQASGDLIHIGPTGTNVMDLTIAIKSDTE